MVKEVTPRIDNDETHTEYWTALGRFLDRYSFAEHALLNMLRRLTDLSHNAAWALLSGTRARAAQTFVNRFLDAQGTPEDLERKARLAAPFAQFGVITDMRNNLVHWQVRTGSRRTETVYISNGHVWPPDERLSEMRLTIANLHEMREDAMHIGMFFANETLQYAAGTAWEDYLPMPWLYKSPPPSPRRNRNPGVAQARRHPPSAWPEILSDS